jgi:hypothetical protein
MTQEEMALVMERMAEEEDTARAAGQKEYSHGDAFGNFNRLAAKLKIDRKLVLWIYVEKHFDGILAYINGHKSQREDVRGRIKDARVYLALLRGMIEEDEQQDTQSPMAPNYEAGYSTWTPEHAGR